jgi:putative peptidoglycan lipid II flippase
MPFIFGCYYGRLWLKRGCLLSSDQSSSTKTSDQSVAVTGKRIRKNAKIVGLFTLLSRVLGAIREIILLHVFGAGAVLDAFIVAFTIPNVLRRLTAEGALAMVFVPLYIEIKEKRSLAAARLFGQKVASLVVVGTSVLTGLGMLFSPQIVSLFASGFVDSPAKFDLTVQLTQMMFPYLIFISLTALAMGLLNSEQKFASPAAAPVFLNLSIIVAALGFSSYFEQPIVAAGWGVLAGGVIQFTLQIPFLLQIKQPLKPRNFLNDPDIQRLLKLMAPMLFGIAVYQINIIILRNIGSKLPDGHITYYNAASRLQELVIGVLAFAYATASLPEFSRLASNEQWDKVYESVSETVSSAFFLLLPATAGYVAFALPVVSMLYLHGEFYWSDVMITATALQIAALGIPAAALIRILVAIFFATKDTRSPVAASAVSLTVTATVGPYLSQLYEVYGLVLTLTISMWVQVLALALLLARRSHAHKGWFPLLQTVKYLVMSVLMGAGVYAATGLANWQDGPLSWYNWLIFITVIIVAAIGYIVAMALAKDPHADDMLRMLRLKR